MPLNIDFLSLKKNLKKDFNPFPIYKVAIVGDSSTQLLHQAIKGYGYEHKINFVIYESDYNQINHELLTSTSELYNFKPQFILIFHSTQKLISKFQECKEKASFADIHIKYLEELVQTVNNNSISSKILYLNFLETPDSVFGNYANQLEESFIFQVRKLNYDLMKFSINHPLFFINDISSLNNLVGFRNSFDPKLYINNDLVFSLDFTALIAKNTVDIILPITGKIKKCLILDLDNTIWGGIIGDDGIDNLQIGDLGIGKAFTILQKWAKQLKERGIILAICSKNTESIAKEPFEKHPDMILKLEDISIFVANWENKADNIRYIQSVLNIGFDSMVFIDDNAFERELVKRELPEITVPDLPNDPALYLPFLTSLNLFETASHSQEDTERTKQYQEEAKRIYLKKSFTSEDDYLVSLEMESTIQPFNNFNIPRVAQLTQRSNQFNLRTIRYTEGEINKIANDKNYVTLSFSLKDKYGEHGLIAAIILKKSNDNFFIDTWVMSCRVLKRGMEQFIVNQIVELSKKHNVNSIIGEYLPTAKNKIVEDLYKNLGFHKKSDQWEVKINKFQTLNTYINAKY